MVELIITGYLTNVLSDFLLLVDLRKLVYSFLLSKRNIKNAKKIHRNQTFWSKVTLAYINEYTIYPKEFKFCQKALIVYMLFVIPQYIFFATTAFFDEKIMMATLIMASIIKFLLLTLLYAQFNEHRVSRFDKRYK